MLFAVLTMLVAVHEPVPACDDAAASAPVVRTVRVHAIPWADLFVDDKLERRFVRFIELTLPVGEHVLVFGNPAAYDEKRVITVPSTGPIPPVQVELRRRPTPMAAMTVSSNVEDADVEVCLPPVTTEATRAKPIEVPLMDSPATVEVRVSRRGFSTVTKRVEVEAGQPVRVNVHLARDDSER